MHVPDDHPAWVKIKAMYEAGDFDTLDRMLQREEALVAMGQMGKLLQAVLLWFGSMIGIFFIIKAWIDNYIGK